MDKLQDDMSRFNLYLNKFNHTPTISSIAGSSTNNAIIISDADDEDDDKSSGTPSRSKASTNLALGSTTANLLFPDTSMARNKFSTGQYVKTSNQLAVVPPAQSTAVNGLTPAAWFNSANKGHTFWTALNSSPGTIFSGSQIQTATTGAQIQSIGDCEEPMEVDHYFSTPGAGSTNPPTYCCIASSEEPMEF